MAGLDDVIALARGKTCRMLARMVNGSFEELASGARAMRVTALPRFPASYIISALLLFSKPEIMYAVRT